MPRRPKAKEGERNQTPPPPAPHKKTKKNSQKDKAPPQKKPENKKGEASGQKAPCPTIGATLKS